MMQLAASEPDLAMGVSYRFDGLSLLDGNKTAGFVAAFQTPMVGRLLSLKPSCNRLDQLDKLVHSRVARSGLLSKRLLSEVQVHLFEESAFPRSLGMDGFAGSLSANVEQLHALKAPTGHSVEPEVWLTPHNVDRTSEALALMVMVVAWAEWASAELYLAAK